MFIDVPEGFEDIVLPYLEKRREEVSTLRTLLAAGEFTAIQRICHNLKGTGSSYGFAKLTALGADMEEAAKSLNEPRLSQGLSELVQYLDAVQLRSAV